MDLQMQDEQLELIHNSPVWAQNVALTCQKRCMIVMDDKRELGKSMLAVRHDNDDMYIYKTHE